MASRSIPEKRQAKEQAKRSVFSRDNPAVLTTVIMAALFLLHEFVMRGVGVVDYHPAPEASRPATYPLLATAIATFILRPRNLAAQACLVVALVVGGDVFFKILFDTGLLSWRWTSSDPAASFGYYLIYKKVLPVFRFLGVGGWAECMTIFQVLMTITMLCACATAFDNPRGWRAIAMSAASSLGVSAIFTGTIIYFQFETIPPLLRLTLAALGVFAPPVVFWTLFRFLASGPLTQQIEIPQRSVDNGRE